MKRSAFLAVVFICIGLALPALAADAPATQPSALAAIEAYVGEWHIKAAWSDGRPLEARAVYTWGLNKKFIEARTFVKTSDGGEYQRYLTIFADVDGKVTLYGFTFDGSTDVRTASMDGGKMSMQWKAHGSNVGLRQTTELTDPTHMRWHVEIQGADGAWTTLMDGVWVRA